MLNSFVALDLETTGTSASFDKIIEIGAIKVVEGKIIDEFATFVNPQIAIPERITQLTGINDDMVRDSEPIESIIGQLVEFIGKLPLLGHNVIFDYSFVKQAAINSEISFNAAGIDTLKLAKRILPDIESRKLEFLCDYFSLDAGSSHRALDDARSAMQLYRVLYELDSKDEYFYKTIELVYKIKKKQPATQAQIRYLTALVTDRNIVLQKDINDLTKNEASRIIDMILSNQLGKL